ncbi:MAG: VirB8 family type IV secretion system protein [Burkholderiales bacterium]
MLAAKAKQEKVAFSQESGEPEVLKQYFEEAYSWNEERQALIQKSEKRAWTITKASMGVAALSIVALILLLPLKQTNTELLVADKSTGNIERMTKLDVARVSLEDVFIKNFVSRFMRAREEYNPTMNEQNYYTAAAFMSPQLQDQWGHEWDPTNPNNLIKQYGQDTLKRIEISSIVVNRNDDGSKNTVTVRYSVTITRGGVTSAPDYRIANLSFTYTDLSKNERDRRINPAGFEITSLQTDEEVGGRAAQPAAVQIPVAQSQPVPVPVPVNTIPGMPGR